MVDNSFKAPALLTIKNNTSVNVIEHQWDFGDPASSANISSQANPTHTYSNAGEYILKYRAKGNSSTKDTSIKLLIKQSSFIQAFTFDKTTNSFPHYGYQTTDGNYFILVNESKFKTFKVDAKGSKLTEAKTHAQLSGINDIVPDGDNGLMIAYDITNISRIDSAQNMPWTPKKIMYPGSDGSQIDYMVPTTSGDFAFCGIYTKSTTHQHVGFGRISKSGSFVLNPVQSSTLTKSVESFFIWGISNKSNNEYSVLGTTGFPAKAALLTINSSGLRSGIKLIPEIYGNSQSYPILLKGENFNLIFIGEASNKILTVFRFNESGTKLWSFELIDILAADAVISEDRNITILFYKSNSLWLAKYNFDDGANIWINNLGSFVPNSLTQTKDKGYFITALKGNDQTMHVETLLIKTNSEGRIE